MGSGSLYRRSMKPKRTALEGKTDSRRVGEKGKPTTFELEKWRGRGIFVRRRPFQTRKEEEL